MKWFKRREPEVVKVNFQIEFNDGKKMFLDYDWKEGTPLPEISSPIWELNTKQGLYFFRWDKIRFVSVYRRKEERKG